MNRETQLQVKRINNRLSDLVNAYGEENEQVKKYISILGQVSTYDPTKTYRIKTPSKLNANDLDLINRADRLGTMSTYTSAKYEEFKYLYADEIENDPNLKNLSKKDLIKTQQFKEYVQESSDFSEFIKQNSQLIYNSSPVAKSYLQETGKPHLSKENYNYILKLMNDLKKNKMQVIEDYDEQNNEDFNPFEEE